MKRSIILIVLSFSFLIAYSQWNWQDSHTNEILTSIQFLNDNKGWAAGHEGIVVTTNNGGATWFIDNSYNNSVYQVYFKCVCFQNMNEGVITGYARYRNSPYWSENFAISTTNGGNNWNVSSINIFVNYHYGFYEISIINNSVWQLYSQGKIYNSLNGLLGDYTLQASFPGRVWGMHFLNENIGWVSGSDGMLFKTTDGGSTWIQVTTNTTVDLYDVYFINEAVGFITGFNWDDSVHGFYKTTDGGQSWYSPNYPDSIRYLGEITFVNNLTGWACGSKYFLTDSELSHHGIVLYTDDAGENWTEQETDKLFNLDHFSDMSFISETKGWLCSLVGGIYKTVNAGGAGTGYDLHFSSLAQMNDARVGIGYTYDGNNFYSVCGGTYFAPFRSTTIESYNISNEKWTVFATDMIPRKYCSAEYLSSQNSIYVFNGETYNDNSYTDTIEIIDIQSGQVSYTTSNPYPVEYGGSAVWNNKIYVFGGSNSEGFSNRLYEYDPVTNIWTRLPDMPEAKQTNGEIINGILYVIGGYNGSSSARVDAYEIQNSSWMTLEELPAGISAHSMTTSGNNIWIIGSYNNIHMVALYNTETNEFTQLNSNMIGRRHCGVCIQGTDLYVYGGNQNTGFILKSLQSADISSYIHSIDEYVDHQMIIITNFPNPFTSTTILSYTLERPENVHFTIYNLQGQVVDRIQERQDKGVQRVQWNAEGLPAGIYYFRIQAGDKVGGGKMVLLR